MKERILSAAGYRWRYGKGRGVADDDHRSSYSTIVDGSSMDGKGRTHGRSRHCAISNANVKSDLILDKFNNSLPSNALIFKTLVLAVQYEVNQIYREVMNSVH